MEENLFPCVLGGFKTQPREMQSREGIGWLRACGGAGHRRGWQHGHCLCPLPNADALIIIVFFYSLLSPFATVWGPKSLPVCNLPAPGLNREVAPSMSEPRVSPAWRRGPGGPWAKGAPSPSNNQATALLHSAAPNPHALEPNWPLPGTGAA